MCPLIIRAGHFWSGNASCTIAGVGSVVTLGGFFQEGGPHGTSDLRKGHLSVISVLLGSDMVTQSLPLPHTPVHWPLCLLVAACRLQA